MKPSTVVCQQIQNLTHCKRKKMPQESNRYVDWFPVIETTTSRIPWNDILSPRMCEHHWLGTILLGNQFKHRYLDMFVL